MTDCHTCNKTAVQLKARSGWECSHVECPQRRGSPQLDHHETTGNEGARLRSRFEAEVGTGGCYRTLPTTKD